MEKIGMIEGMAVLWKQRAMVRQLDILARRHARENVDATPFVVGVFYSGNGNFFLAENELIDFMLDQRGTTREDIDSLNELKKILNACIKHEFIEAADHQSFGGRMASVDTQQSSARVIQVDSDKGAELLNFWYFWLKYIPSTFPDPAKLALSTVTAIVAAVITALLVVFGLKGG